MGETIGIQRRIHNLREPKCETERRGVIGEIFTFLSRFTLESTVIQSLGFSTGRKRVGSKDEVFLAPFSGEKRPRDVKLATEEMQADINRRRQRHKTPSSKCSEISDESLRAKIEKMQEDMNDLAPQCKMSNNCVAQSGTSEKKPEGDYVKGLNLVGKNRRRVFIRSRL